MPGYNQMVGSNPYDDYSNQQNNQMHPMQMNGPPGNRPPPQALQRMPPNMQPPFNQQQQMHYGQNMMPQQNYNPQMNGQMILPQNMQPQNHMNGPPLVQNQHMQMQNNQMNMNMNRPNNGQMMGKTYPPGKAIIKNAGTNF